ncbi:MAG: DUF4878 domain-containing protein [Alloprevotella sp.]
MKHLIKLMALCLVFVLAACSGNGPSAVADQAFSYLKTGDYEKYVGLIYSEKSGEEKASAEEQQAMTEMLASKFKMAMAKKGGIKSYEIVSEEIDDAAGTAVVTVRYTTGKGDQEEEEVKLRQDEDGNWKLKLF